MQQWQIAAIIVAAVIIVVVAGWFMYRESRSRRLRNHFGREYDRTVTEFGSRRQAEDELLRRRERVRHLLIRPLSSVDQVHFAEQWRLCQAQFVDNPTQALESADRLVVAILRARGYAADNPQARLADISAAYPRQAESYRFASDVLNHGDRGAIATEDLREAFLQYRKLFD